MSRLEQMLMRHEGFSPHAYQDSEGYWTIGYGRMIDKRLGGRITREEARRLLLNDISEKEDACRRIFGPTFDNLDEARRSALTDMAFMGEGSLSGFKKMIAAIHDGDFNRAAAEALKSKWARQVGSRATEISEMLRTGEWQH